MPSLEKMMLKLISVDDAARATILAALAYYREQGMGDPEMRSENLHDIATGGTIGTGLVPLGGDAIEALEEQVRRAAGVSASKAGLFAHVEDVDGQVTVHLHDTEQLARKAIERSLSEYPNLSSRELKEARQMLDDAGWCKVDRNLGHSYEIVEITNSESLELVARARQGMPALAPADLPDLPGLEGWVAADENTRELIPGAVYSCTLGGGDSGYATYDLTIVRDDREELPFIPMHGSVKMHGAPSPADAARMLMSYWADLPDASKRVAARPYLDRPRS